MKRIIVFVLILLVADIIAHLFGVDISSKEYFIGVIVGLLAQAFADGVE